MARASWRHGFERDRDFIVFRRPLKICGKEFAPGDPFDKSLVPTRKLRHLYEAYRITVAGEVVRAQRKRSTLESPAQAPSDNDETLIGSNVLASTYEIAGATVQLGDIVAAAHALSGMTVAEWNALPDDDREALLRLELDRLLAEVPSPDVPEVIEVPADGIEKTPVTVPADGTMTDVPPVDSEGAPDLSKLRADYTALMGKKPYMGWKAEDLQKRIYEALAS